MEDYRIGRRLSAIERLVAVSGVASQVAPQNSKRVRIEFRFSSSGGTVYISSIGLPVVGGGVAMSSFGLPIVYDVRDQGRLCQQAFFVIASASFNLTVIETVLEDD